MKTTAMAAGLAVMLLASAACVLGQEPPKPSVINSTYTITDRLGKLDPVTTTFRLQEDDGKLTYFVNKGKGEAKVSVEYAKISRVGKIVSPVPIPGSRNLIEARIDDSEGHVVFVRLRSVEEADSLSEYIGRRAGLELIGDAWRVRKLFQCPEPAQAGCLDFKELLDHNDPEIVSYFYDHFDPDARTFACFNSSESRFFVLQYGHTSDESKTFLPDTFLLKTFEEGQEGSTEAGEIKWRGDLGSITDLERARRGSIDSSSLSFYRTFTNKTHTTTDYTLDIRWSTGRYSEEFSWKDDKGKPVLADSSGICVKLNEPAPMQIPKGATLAEPTKP